MNYFLNDLLITINVLEFFLCTYLLLYLITQSVKTWTSIVYWSFLYIHCESIDIRSIITLYVSFYFGSLKYFPFVSSSQQFNYDIEALFIIFLFGVYCDLGYIIYIFQYGSFSANVFSNTVLPHYFCPFHLEQ